MSATPHEPAAIAQLSRPRARAATVERGSFRTESARLDLAAASCRGMRHDVNEDSHSALDAPEPVYIVADGVGGGAMAARASRELVSRVHEALQRAPIDEDSVRRALLMADLDVGRSIASHTDELGAATVALCASVGSTLSDWIIAWVGDCRVYRLAEIDRDAELLTRDDTYRHLSETPPPGGSLDDPARMVGNGAVASPNLAHASLNEDQMLVLCSDGVHKHVQPREIARLLRGDSAPLVRRCTRVIALARMRGGADDATVLVVHRAR